MAKKRSFKLNTYEKDNDDLYVVIVNPWTRGRSIPYDQSAVNWIGAWLRLATRKASDGSLVVAVLTMESRSEVIAQLRSDADRSRLLGEHRWEQFMDSESQETLRRVEKVNIQHDTTQVFEYKWNTNGDPSERQWREWHPHRGRIPENSFLVSEFPRPTWIPLPRFSQLLAAIILPLPKQEEIAIVPSGRIGLEGPTSESSKAQNPEPSGKDIASAQRTRDTDAPPGAGSSSNRSNFVPYKRPTQLQVCLDQAPTTPTIEAEAEERKPAVKAEGRDDDFSGAAEQEELKPKIEEGGDADPVMLSYLVNEYISQSEGRTESISGASNGKRTYTEQGDCNSDEHDGEDSETPQIKRVKQEHVH